MLLHQKDGKVETSEALTKQAFQIETSRQAFKILSSGIYSDKVRAVIRELCTNAMDSHRDAGNTEPFEIHLPNAFEPHFSVKDNGTGMSDDDIKTLYTTYFKSTRGDSNDFTGCLGLGSKAPFCYSEQFTVESRYNGVLSVYNCFVDADGSPTVAGLSRTKTKDRNGMEIKFSVPTQDFREFIEKAESVLQWFKPQPTVTGVPNFKCDTYEWLFSTSEFGLQKHSNGSHVVMGSVAYALEADDLGHLNEDLERLLNHGVDIFLPLGAVGIAASREKMEYTKETLKVLKELMPKILKEVQQFAIKIFDSCKTLWDARLKYVDYHNTVIGAFLPSPLLWQNKVVTDNVRLSEYKNPVKVENLRLGFMRKTGACHSLKKPKVHDIRVDRTPIIYNDLATGGYTAAHHFLESNRNCSRVYFISPKHIVSGYIPDSTTNKPDFLTESGLSEVWILASTLPKPPVSHPYNYTSQGSRKYKTLRRFWSDSSSSYGEDYWEDAEKNMKEGGYYGIVCRGCFDKLLTCANGFHPINFKYAMKWCEIVSGKKFPELWGIRPADVSRLEKLDNWKPIGEYFQEVLANVKPLLDPVSQQASSWRTLDNSAMKKYFRHQLAVKSLFGEFISKCQECYKAYENPKVDAYRQFSAWMGHKLNLVDPMLTNMFKKLSEPYPLLPFMSINRDDIAFRKALLNYVNLCDQRAGLSPSEEVEDDETS